MRGYYPPLLLKSVRFVDNVALSVNAKHVIAERIKQVEQSAVAAISRSDGRMYLVNAQISTGVIDSLLGRWGKRVRRVVVNRCHCVVRMKVGAINPPVVG